MNSESPTSPSHAMSLAANPTVAGKAASQGGPEPLPERDAAQAVNQMQQLAQDSIAEAQQWVRVNALARAIPEAIPDAVVVIDEDGRIVLVNTQFEIMFGYHRSYAIGREPEFLLPEAARAHHVELRHGFLSDPRVRDMAGVLHARRRNGSAIAVQIRLGPVVTAEGTFVIASIRRAGQPSNG